MSTAVTASERGLLSNIQSHASVAACTTPNVGQTERWISLAAGGAMLLDGLRRGGILELTLGGFLVYRGATGHCSMYQALGVNTARDAKSRTAVPAQQGFKYEKSIAINRHPEDLFDYWRNFENLPRVMRHLRSVTVQPGGRSHWVAAGPLGLQVEWDAEIINEEHGRLIAWRSLPGSTVDTAGSVHFDENASGRGTLLTVSLKYNPPGGQLGANIAWLMGASAEQEIEEDLRRFKQSMESSGSSQPATAGSRRF
jgi:uncharacterized membrane protein